MAATRASSQSLMGLFGRSYNRAMLVENFLNGLVDFTPEESIAMLHRDMTLLFEYGSMTFQSISFKQGVDSLVVGLPKITAFQFALYRATEGNSELLHKLMACLPLPSGSYDFKRCSLDEELARQLNELYENGLLQKSYKRDLDTINAFGYKGRLNSVPTKIEQMKEKFDDNKDITQLKQELEEDWYARHSRNVNILNEMRHRSPGV